MSITDYVVGWTVVNGLFAAGVIAGFVAWFAWSACSARVRRWRCGAPESEPAPAPLAITALDRAMADLADRRMLWEIEDAFNRQGHA